MTLTAFVFRKISALFRVFSQAAARASNLARLLCLETLLFLIYLQEKKKLTLGLGVLLTLLWIFISASPWHTIFFIPAAGSLTLTGLRIITGWMRTFKYRQIFESSKKSRTIPWQPFEPLPAGPEYVKAPLEEGAEAVVRPLAEQKSPAQSQVDLVARRWNGANVLLVRKKYPNADCFYRSITCLMRLGHLPFVPKVFFADAEKLTVWMSFVPGRTLEELRFKANETLMSTPEWQALKGNKPGQVRRLLSAAQMEFLKEALLDFHRAGVVIKDVHYSNIIINPDNGVITLCDFASAEYYDRSSLVFLIRRHQDCSSFNKKFGTDILTIHSMRKKIAWWAGERKTLPWYSPVDFGWGITAGLVGGNEDGDRKWDYIIRKNAGDIQGKRILDLGSNNGNISMQALRCGAGEVVAVEKDPFYFKQALFVHEAYEWMDAKRYRFSICNDDILNIDALAPGRFDIVFALNCIYYLTEKDFQEVLRKLHSRTGLLLMQCNISGQFSVKELNERSSVAYALKNLEACGYKVVKIVHPPFYFRPLIVAAPAGAAK